MSVEKKVNACGFKLKLSKNVSFDALYQNLQSKCDKDVGNGFAEQIFYINKEESYVIGSALTFKGHKKSIESKRDNAGNLIIERSEIRSDATGIEPTLFAINPNSLRGVYYKNFGSPSLSTFKRIFKAAHDEIKETMLQDAVLKECIKQKIDENDKAKVQHIRKKLVKQFEGELHIEVLTDPFDLKDLLSKFNKINKCEITATTALSDAPIFTPITPHLKETKVGFSFEQKNSSLLKLKEAILTSFGNEEFKTLKLIGKGFSGEELSEIVGEVKHYYHSYTYDEFIDKLPSGKWIDYTKSPAMYKLIEIIKKNPAVFNEN